MPVANIGTKKMAYNGQYWSILANIGQFWSSYIGQRHKKIVPIIYIVFFHVLENWSPIFCYRTSMLALYSFIEPKYKDYIGNIGHQKEDMCRNIGPKKMAYIPVTGPRPQAEDLWLEYRPFFEDLYSITSDFCVSYILYNTI